MNTMQTFLTIGALILLSLLVLNVNRSIITNEDIEINSEAVTTAASVGQSFMNEILSKRFDEGTKNNPVMNFLYMTAPDSLHPEPGEVYSSYDDVDDFNNYSKFETTPRIGVYSLKANVNYVDDVNVNTSANVKTRTKMVKVSVYNNILKDTLKIYSYRCY